MSRILTLISLLLAVTFVAACGEDEEQTTTTGSEDTSDTANDNLPLSAGPYPIADLSISFDDFDEEGASVSRRSCRLRRSHRTRQRRRCLRG